MEYFAEFAKLVATISGLTLVVGILLFAVGMAIIEIRYKYKGWDDK